jgi:hypothetical protein
MIFAKEISKYNSGLVGVQEIRWDRGEVGPDDSHNILNMWKNYFSQSLNEYSVSDVR